MCSHIIRTVEVIFNPLLTDSVGTPVITGVFEGCLEGIGYHYSDITSSIAAYVLRDAAQHGDVNWQRALKSYNNALAEEATL